MGLTLGGWDRLPESERAWWLERDRIQRNRHSCGHDRDVCGDAEHGWFPQLTVCYADMEREAAQAKFQRLHEDRPWHDGTFPEDPKKWAKEPSAKHPYHFQHGTTIWVAETDLGHGGDFLSGASRAHQGDDNES